MKWDLARWRHLVGLFPTLSGLDAVKRDKASTDCRRCHRFGYSNFWPRRNECWRRPVSEIPILCAVDKLSTLSRTHIVSEIPVFDPVKMNVDGVKNTHRFENSNSLRHWRGQVSAIPIPHTVNKCLTPSTIVWRRQEHTSTCRQQVFDAVKNTVNKCLTPSITHRFGNSNSWTCNSVYDLYSLIGGIVVNRSLECKEADEDDYLRFELTSVLKKGQYKRINRTMPKDPSIWCARISKWQRSGFGVGIADVGPTHILLRFVLA